MSADVDRRDFIRTAVGAGIGLCTVLVTGGDGREEKVALDVVRSGVLGDLIHAEYVLLEPEGSRTLRAAPDLLLAAGVVPAWHWFDVSRDNRFESVVSRRGRSGWRTILMTARGQTLLLSQGTGAAPGSTRRILLQGTKGMWLSRRLLADVRTGGDVCDAVTWSAIAHAGRQSVLNPGQVVEIPA